MSRHHFPDTFCPHCGVSLDLHPWEDENKANCDLATAKADLMDLFYRGVRR